MRSIAVLLLAGCTDVFTLPIGGGGGDGDLSGVAGDGMSGDGTDDLGDGFVDLDGGADFNPNVLPASCAQLACTPAMNEGDVNLPDHASGCHAYQTLTINGSVAVMSGQSFAACAETIVVGGALSADARGNPSGMGAGSGKSCLAGVGSSGGSYGGAGGDPGGCGAGATYGSMMLPRDFGSGAGGSNGGAGGGQIELAAKQIHLIGFITANGESSATGGGGSGGSILVHADTVDGLGQLQARGGAATVNPQAGGGGGGRIALVLTTAAPQLTIDVKGGGAQGSGGAGADGTIVRVP